MVHSNTYDRAAEKECSGSVRDLTTVSVVCAHGYRLVLDVGSDGDLGNGGGAGVSVPRTDDRREAAREDACKTAMCSCTRPRLDPVDSTSSGLKTNNGGLRSDSDSDAVRHKHRDDTPNDHPLERVDVGVCHPRCAS